MAYHAVVNLDGSTTEHAGLVSLAAIPNGLTFDGTVDPQVLVVSCPLCPTTAYVPLLGDAEAQRLHSYVRAARGTSTPRVSAAVLSVIDDVTRLGGRPRLNPQEG